jgi:hypothetical protein
MCKVALVNTALILLVHKANDLSARILHCVLRPALGTNCLVTGTHCAQQVPHGKLCSSVSWIASMSPLCLHCEWYGVPIRNQRVSLQTCVLQHLWLFIRGSSNSHVRSRYLQGAVRLFSHNETRFPRGQKGKPTSWYFLDELFLANLFIFSNLWSLSRRGTMLMKCWEKGSYEALTVVEFGSSCCVAFLIFLVHKKCKKALH